MFLHSVSFSTLLISGAIIKYSDFAIPRGTYDGCFLGPIIEAADIILFLLAALFGFLEFLHFSSILDVDGEQAALLVTDEELSLSFIHSDASDLLP